MAKGKTSASATKSGSAVSKTKPAAAKPKSGGANPLLERWATPFAIPPFGRIAIEHFMPAFDRGFAANRKEIAAIAGEAAAPTFANTIDKLERSGDLLDRVASVFFNLAATDTNDEIQAIERALAPRFAKHSMRIYQDAALFARVDALFKKRKKLKLSEEQVRVLERYHRAFVKSGAGLEPKARKRMAAIAARLSVLGTKFSQNLLADEQAFVMVLEGEADLAGLPDSVRAAAAQTASERGHPGKHAITLSRSSIEPFLQFSARRDLRERAFKAWIMRGANGGATDNRKIVAEVLGLRAERARLLGFKTAADSALEFSMAKTPAAVRKLLMEVWGPARTRAAEERDKLQEAVRAEGGNFKLAAWDWRYYAEKVRKAEFDVDDGEIKPYLQLDSVIAAAFDCATKLFGVTFTECKDLPVYHPEVRAWEVKRGARHVGIFLGDYFARPSKHSGAWMSGWRKQEKLAGDIHPVVVNVMNFAKGQPGEPTLLSLDDARTLFHEFGHGLHGLLSNVTYPSVSGTSVEKDFVELPSQLYEHWFTRPEVLSRFARHCKSGKVVPPGLLARMDAARNFNQGFKTIEYLAAAIVDLDLHVLEKPKGLDVDRFEAETLGRVGMPEEIVMRHRIPHFQHIMGGYAAGYYSYLWSEVMDADAFEAFEEAGDIFDPKLARRLYDNIYSAGGKQDPAEAYVGFRGRLPATRALLEKRGLVAAVR
jgi:peptidyl-dipeptidase Dcp